VLWRDLVEKCIDKCDVAESRCGKERVEAAATEGALASAPAFPHLGPQAGTVDGVARPGAAAVPCPSGEQTLLEADTAVQEADGRCAKAEAQLELKLEVRNVDGREVARMLSQFRMAQREFLKAADASRLVKMVGIKARRLPCE